MKKLFALFAIVAVVVGLPAVSAKAQVLYRVEKTGSEHVSYLLGTHHFAPLWAVDSIAELPAALANVDRLYGEIDMSLMTDPAAMPAMQQKMVAPADSTLDKVLTVAQLDSVGAVMNDLTGGQLPLQMLYALKPAVLSAQIAAFLSAKALPELNPAEGIDVVMQNRARELGKPVAGLETVDFQCDMLYGRPIAEQARELMKTVAEIDDQAEKAVALSNAYIAHDIEAIYNAMLEMEGDDAEAAERMIYARNDAWVRKLTEEMGIESLMVVVGAGHLPGPRGVVEGLRKAGYTVTPVE